MVSDSSAPLSARLLRELSAALPEIYGCTTRLALVQAVTQLLARYIPSESGSYAALEPARASAIMVNSNPEVAIRIQRHLPALWAHQVENAYFQGKLDSLVGCVCQTSDWISDRELEHTGLYQEFLRPIGAKRQLVLLIDTQEDGTRISYGLQRDDRDFSSRERAVFEFLRPHLLAAHQQIVGQERSHHAWSSLSAALVSGLQGTVELDGQLHPLRWNEAAEKWLGMLVPRSRWSIGLPKVLINWARQAREQCRYAGRAEPWTHHLESGALRAELLWEAVSGHSLLLLDMPAGGSSTTCASAFGLTPRESEVLYWVAHGKTNTEIATILGIRYTTVAKHVEHVLMKLGAENRVTAAAMAWEHLGKSLTGSE